LIADPKGWAIVLTVAPDQSDALPYLAIAIRRKTGQTIGQLL
jgi:hypothetical protein